MKMRKDRSGLDVPPRKVALEQTYKQVHNHMGLWKKPKYKIYALAKYSTFYVLTLFIYFILGLVLYRNTSAGSSGQIPSLS